MLILSLLPRIILHLAPSAIRADRVDCSTLCWCSEMPWIFAAARGYCQVGSSTGTVLCTAHYTPAHWEKFYYLSLHLISGLSPLIWDQGLTGTGVTPSANQRPVLPPVTNERPASGDWTDPWCLTPGLPPLSCWAGLVSPLPRSRLHRLAQAAQEARSLFWCPRLSWRWGSEDWIASHHTRPQHFRSIIRQRNRYNPLWEKFSVRVNSLNRRMTIVVDFSFQMFTL